MADGQAPVDGQAPGNYPDSDATRKIAVTFERKLTDGNYGHTMTRGWAEATVPETATAEQVYQGMIDLANAVKSAVLTEMGIEFTFDTVNGVVVEVAPVVNVQSQAAPAQSQGAAPVQSGGATITGHGITVANPNDQDGPLPDWAVNAFQRDGVTRVYDNRKTATGNQPIFKEALGRGMSSSLTADGKAKGYWPPK